MGAERQRAACDFNNVIAAATIDLVIGIQRGAELEEIIAAFALDFVFAAWVRLNTSALSVLSLASLPGLLVYLCSV